MYTYFVKNNVNNLVKIGKAKNISERIKGIAGQCSFVEISLLHFVEGDYENKYHNLFKAYRKAGEWFDIPDLNPSYIDAEYEKMKSDNNFAQTQQTKPFQEQWTESESYFRFIITNYKLFGHQGVNIINAIYALNAPIDKIVVQNNTFTLTITETSSLLIQVRNPQVKDLYIISVHSKRKKLTIRIFQPSRSMAREGETK